MGDFIKAVGILFIILIHSSSLFSREIYISKNVDFADQLIEKGATNTAYFILKKELKNKNYSTLDKYKITKLISRCFLKEMDFTHYDEYNSKAYHIVKNKEEIYKAQYYIERVYFFHHLTWADSVVYYSKKAKTIFDRNKKDVKLIEIPFFYQIYAISHLYSVEYDNKFDNNRLKTPMRWVRIFQYYDSAIFYNQYTPYRKKSDLALLYRGIGNRHLDLVSGYVYPKKVDTTKLSALSYYCYKKAKSSYTKANSLLDKNNIIEIISNYSLLGLLEMCVGNQKVANIYFDSMQSIYDKNKGPFIPNNVYLCGLNYKRMNDFNSRFDLERTKESIYLLEKIVPKWISQINSLHSYSYDIYSFSPFFQLFYNYSRLYFNTHKSEYLSKAVSNLISEKIHFKKIKNKSNFEYYRMQSSYYEMDRLKIKSDAVYLNSLKKTNENRMNFFDVKLLMKKLKKDEAILLNYKADVHLKNKRILVTNKKISFIKFKEINEFTQLNLNEVSLKAYKKIAFKAYYNSLFNALKIKKNLKRIYILYDDDFGYDKLIMRKTGKAYSELNYLINKIEIIKLYDFQSFFCKPIINKKLNVTKFLLVDDLKSNLPFMYNFKPTSLCARFKEKKCVNFVKEFKNDEVLHFVGHGNDSYIDSNGQQHQNQIIHSNSNKYKSTEKFDSNKKVKSPLIILNNCFSGVRVSYSYVYDKGIYLQLMNMNAKNIVVSGDKIDDYVSSRIMLYFYTYLSQGKFVGEALVYAKRKFLKENKNGYANPKYWSPFFSISSQKVRFNRE